MFISGLFDYLITIIHYTLHLQLNLQFSTCLDFVVATRRLTQCDGALGPWTRAPVLREVKSQRVVSYGLGDLPKILHQVSAQGAVQEGIPQGGRGAIEIPCHGGDKRDSSLTRLRGERERIRRTFNTDSCWKWHMSALFNKGSVYIFVTWFGG